jgi:peptide deformylase
MAVRPIVVYPDPVLLQPTRPVREIDRELHELVADMIETMHAEPGVGLAANQVGVPLRVMVVDVTAGEEEGRARAFLNPEIVSEEGLQTGEEGCLSFPGLTEVVDRPERVTIRYLDLEGNTVEETAEGFYARALLHEIDHLDGVVFLARMSPLKRDLLKRKIRKLQKAGEWPAAS